MRCSLLRCVVHYFDALVFTGSPLRAKTAELHLWKAFFERLAHKIGYSSLHQSQPPKRPNTRSASSHPGVYSTPPRGLFFKTKETAVYPYAPSSTPGVPCPGTLIGRDWLVENALSPVIRGWSGDAFSSFRISRDFNIVSPSNYDGLRPKNLMIWSETDSILTIWIFFGIRMWERWLWLSVKARFVKWVTKKFPSLSVRGRGWSV